MIKSYKKNKFGGGNMAKKVTTKKPLSGNKRSHALNATKTKQKPNIQKKKKNKTNIII